MEKEDKPVDEILARFHGLQLKYENNHEDMDMKNTSRQGRAVVSEVNDNNYSPHSVYNIIMEHKTFYAFHFNFFYGLQFPDCVYPANTFVSEIALPDGGKEPISYICISYNPNRPIKSKLSIMFSCYADIGKPEDDRPWIQPSRLSSMYKNIKEKLFDYIESCYISFDNFPDEKKQYYQNILGLSPDDY